MNRTPLAPTVGHPPDLAASYRDKGYWSDETLDDLLSRRARWTPTARALVGVRATDPRHRTTLTYAALDAEVNHVARMLSTAGVAAGDRVVVQLPNVVELVTSVFGILRAGALPVFALPAHRDAEIGAFCRIADAAAHVVAGRGWGHDYLALAARVSASLTEDGHAPPMIIDVERWEVSAADQRRQAFPRPVVAASEVAFLQLSGGTTGTPKLIPRTHADYLYSVRESARICGVDADTVMLVALPATHNFPMSSPGILGVLHAGGTVVLAPDPSPRTAFRLVEEERVTMASLVPPLLQAWLALAARGRYDLRSLDVVQVGGARLADVTAARVRPELGARLQQVFGMAEGLVCYTRLDDPEYLVLTTQGRPMSPDDEILVVDGDDRPVPDGEEGHLLTRGPYTIRGYYRADDHNATAFTPDGFYRTGDLVRRLPSGHLRVTGRAKDQINRGGDKIAVEEVENALLSHPAVHDAAVVAAPDAYLGERVVAFAVATDDTIDGEALKEHLRAVGLATFKIPDRVELVDAFPVTGVGKTSRVALRRALTRDLAAATSDERSNL